MRFPFLRERPIAEEIEFRRAAITAGGSGLQLRGTLTEPLPISPDIREEISTAAGLASAHLSLADLLYCAGAPLREVKEEQQAGLGAATMVVELVSPVARALAGSDFGRQVSHELTDALATALLVEGASGETYVSTYSRLLAQCGNGEGASGRAADWAEGEEARRAMRYHRGSSPEDLIENAYGGGLDLYGLSAALARPESREASVAWRSLLWWWGETLYAGAMRALVWGVDARSRWLHPRALVILKTAARVGLLNVGEKTAGTLRPFVAYLEPQVDADFEPLPQDATVAAFLEAVVEHSRGARGEGLERAAHFLVEVGWGVREYGGHFPTAAADIAQILGQRWGALPTEFKEAVREATARPSRMCRSSGRPAPREWLELVRD